VPRFLLQAEASIAKAHVQAAEMRAGEAAGDVFVTVDVDLPVGDSCRCSFELIGAPIGARLN
jgi:hypothetical protein